MKKEKWISVNERKPKKWQECLVAFYVLELKECSGHAYILATYIDGDFYTFEADTLVNRVTHWMKLPRPPKIKTCSVCKNEKVACVC